MALLETLKTGFVMSRPRNRCILHLTMCLTMCFQSKVYGCVLHLTMYYQSSVYSPTLIWNPLPVQLDHISSKLVCLTNLTLCTLGNFFMLLLFADFFLKSSFPKILSGISSECQTDWIQSRPDILSGLIWVQSVSLGYEQKTLVGNELRSKYCSGSQFMKIALTHICLAPYIYGKYVNSENPARMPQNVVSDQGPHGLLTEYFIKNSIK